MFALGLAMHGKLYAGAQDILDMLGLAGDLGNGLLFFVSPLCWLGRGPGAGDHRRLRHQASSSWPACSTSSLPSTPTISAPGGKS